MQCTCCAAEKIMLGWKVRLCRQEETIFRWAVVCADCYRALDNQAGVAAIGGQTWNLAGASRQGKAAVTVRLLRWQAFAHACAEDAHENFFSSRRGIWFFEDQNVLVFYNNNPYNHDPQLRDRELAAFRRRLEAEGIEELAYAIYPTRGPDAGYTFALVLDAGGDKQNQVAQLYQEAMDEAAGEEV